ncbi:MAG: hypothetical protein MN733_32520 [Nitrososphaera sp.]|nr:hypothetical protein [Nitrososphaera sp.]
MALIKGTEDQAWYDCAGPLTVVNAVSGTAATYQCTNAAHLGKLHEVAATVACYIERGTGSSVTSSNKYLLPAGGTFRWRPRTGIESLGYRTLDNSAFSATNVLTIAVVEQL